MESKLQRFNRLKNTILEIQKTTIEQSQHTKILDQLVQSIEDVKTGIEQCRREIFELESGVRDPKKTNLPTRKKGTRRAKTTRIPNKTITSTTTNSILQGSSINELNAQILEWKMESEELKIEIKELKAKLNEKYDELGGKTLTEYKQIRKTEEESRIEIALGKENLKAALALIFSLALGIIISHQFLYNPEPFMWECDDGEMSITILSVHDGVNNCADGSDESESGFFESYTRAEEALMKYEDDSDLEWNLFLGICCISPVAILIILLAFQWESEESIKKRIEAEFKEEYKNTTEDIRKRRNQYLNREEVARNRLVDLGDYIDKNSKDLEKRITGINAKKSQMDVLSKKQDEFEAELKEKLSQLTEIEGKISEMYQSISDLIPSDGI